MTVAGSESVSTQGTQVDYVQRARQVAVFMLLVFALAICVAGVFTALGQDVQIEPPADFSAGSNGLPETIVEEDVVMMVERPLFWNSRQKYQPPKVVEEVIEEPVRQQRIDSVKVVGLIAAGENSSVVIQDRKNVVRLKLNDVYKGWVLASIDSTKATFVQEGVTELDDSVVKDFWIESREPLPKTWSGEAAPLSIGE